MAMTELDLLPGVLGHAPALGTRPNQSLRAALSQARGCIPSNPLGPRKVEDVALSPEQVQERALKHAQTWTDWEKAANELDLLLKNDQWKIDHASTLCDMKIIKRRMDQLKLANYKKDYDRMLSLLSVSLKRDLGNMCDPQLYERCKLGTKILFDEYIETVDYTIDHLLEHCEEFPDQSSRYLDAFKSARDSFGATALMLSGGGTLGMCHMGVVKALIEHHLLPKVVCGSSAGSIVAAVLCTNRSSTILDKLDDLCKGDLNVFQHVNEPQGLSAALANLSKWQYAFNIENLNRVMQDLLKDVTFKEAYNHTGMVLNIHISSADEHNVPRLLNYLTSPNVVIWSAVGSSCALPILFKAPGLLVKNPETGEVEPWGHGDLKYIDGSIAGDLPAHALERLFNVNHFIASQVNPHVTPSLRKQQSDQRILTRLGWGAVGAVVGPVRFATLTASELAMSYGVGYPIANVIFSVLSQKYDGDITVLPSEDLEIEMGGILFALLKVLKNPTSEFIHNAMKHGERAAWPHLVRIKNSVAIELLLDRAMKAIKTQLVSTRDSNGLGLRRVPSSTKSDIGLSRLRTRSIGTEDAISLSRFSRGRRVAHQPIRSMIEPSTLTSETPMPIIKLLANDYQMLSSSDETHTSGGSSPTTSYDEDEYDDHAIEASRIRRAFLSQPTSPSLSFKTFHWGNEDRHGPGHTPPPEKTSTGSRTIPTGLQMSTRTGKSIDSRMAPPAWKGPKQ